MAYELGRKNVKDLADFDNYAIGLSIPLKRGNTGYFDQNYNTTDQVKSNIVNLLKTNKGERLMQPEFGSGLREILFSQMDDSEYAAAIEDTITNAFERWMPYVTVDTIDVNISNELKDRNKSEVSITFRLGDNVSLDSVTFTIGA